MDILFIVLTLLVGAALGWFIAQSRAAATAERARLLEADLATTRASLAEISALKSQIESALAGERAAAAEKIAALTDAHERLTTSFKALSADALSKNTDEFLKLARESFGKLHQQSADELGKRQQAIDSLVKPLKESLEKVDAKIGEIEKARASAYGQLSEQLKSLGTAQVSLQAEAAKLTTALRSTTTAGTWGELQLRRVVELSGMSSYCDFTEQQSTGGFRPDLIVRLPGGQQIVVDAKAPNDAYREAVNASDDTVRTAKLAEHATKVRNHIDALGAKNYWEQFQPSPEFVVLFLPGDQFLSGALQGDPSLIDRAIAKKVLLATPATLIALLKAAAYGWRQEDISKNAQVIADLGRTLYDRIAGFADNLDKVGRGLETASKAYNSAVGSFESTVLPGARKFNELGAKGAKELTEPAPVETTPRDVLKRA
ncbi:DNA recombination protein RmuC [Lacunisphaera limnophila]|uniref:DNA recombination protein RmuC n=1 Tax=Lacunisphaera limnophila TaxID=1838286 RepID=A0A1D8AVB9_9BACT|nr:DNA recombination protein RmuC [Lacunisphaera limnophila]AOS44839.1 DNA recombination protein RmuC [Lacunisphaera limnophila]